MKTSQNTEPQQAEEQEAPNEKSRHWNLELLFLPNKNKLERWNANTCFLFEKQHSNLLDGYGVFC